MWKRTFWFISPLFLIAGLVWAAEINTSSRCSTGANCSIGGGKPTSFTIDTDGTGGLDEFTTPDITFEAFGDAILNTVAGTFDFTRDEAGVVTVTASDDDATTGLTILPGGASPFILGGSTTTTLDLVNNGALTVGSATTDSVTVDTDATGGIDEFTTPDITFEAQGDAIINGASGTFDFTMDESGTVTISGSDTADANTPIILESSGTGAVTVRPDGIAAVTIGDAATTAVTITTDDTGDGTDLVLPADGVDSSEINTIVMSHVWLARDIVTDTAQCAAPGSIALVASGPTPLGIACTDNDAATISSHVTMPDSWDGGTVTFEVTGGQTGASTGAWEMDFEGQCIGSDEAFLAYDNTGEQPVQITLTADDDMLQGTTAAVTLNGTTCAGGDVVFFEGQIDATASAASIETLFEIIAVKMEYTSNVGD